MDGKMFSDKIYINNSGRFEWDFLTLEPFWDKDHDERELKREYLRAYIEAAKNIQSSHYRRTHPNNIPGMFFIKDQTCIPFLFLCKHTLELAMKYKLEDLGAGYPKKHDLKIIWEQIKEKTSIKSDRQIEELVENLDKLDQNYALRYAENKAGKENNNGVIAIHTPRIIEVTERLFNLLIEGEEHNK